MSRYRAAPIPVFAGPSLAGAQLDGRFELRPPAAAGDMLGLLAGPACTTVLIDGLFDARPAPWHKEILVLLARGFRVIGAASMGALRAAELDGFGMIGVGGVYQAYADGRITGDDEVAVLHAPAEMGSRPLSLTQVDVRATLVAAVRAGRLAGDHARLLRDASAGVHYHARSWPTVLAAGRAFGLALHDFEIWLPTGAVNAKRRDAEAALRLAAELAATPPPRRPEPPRTCFLEDLATFAGVALD